MKKALFIVIVSIILLASIVVFSSAFVSHVYPREVRQGQKVDMIVTMFNHGSSSLRDANLEIYIPDLDRIDRSRSLRVRSKSSRREMFEFDIPKNADKGYYPIIVTLQNDDGVRERKHSWIQVI